MEPSLTLYSSKLFKPKILGVFILLVTSFSSKGMDKPKVLTIPLTFAYRKITDSGCTFAKTQE